MDRWAARLKRKGIGMLMKARRVQKASQRPSLAGGIALLAIRGVLLWAVVPLAAGAWLAASSWLRRRGVRLGQFLGWADINLVACLQRSVLRPLFRDPVGWVPARLMPTVTHRIDALGDLM